MSLLANVHNNSVNMNIAIIWLNVNKLCVSAMINQFKAALTEKLRVPLTETCALFLKS